MEAMWCLCVSIVLSAVASCVYSEDRAASLNGDVVVYGGTAAGCMAAIAASRTGARRVLLATPYDHIGGMTTGILILAAVPNNILRSSQKLMC